MQIPLQVTFRHMPTSAAVEGNIRGQISYLEQHFDNITGCRVVIDAPPAHRNKGGPFSVHIDLTVPGREIFVSSERDNRDAHTDVYVAIRDAFEAAKRQLDAHARQLRGEVKTHPSPHNGLS
jgi:ribosome-associated translation inhibitor RaiA